MDLEQTLSTTRAVRKRMDLERPVPREVIVECLQLAVQAPTGGNRQGWQWVIVTDAEKKRQIGEWYRESWYEYASAGRPTYADDDPRRAQLPRVVTSARYLADHMGEAAALVIPCARGDRARLGSSVFPAVQNLMLAARALGLGTTLTDIHLHDEGAVREILGIPEDVQTFAIIPVGYPLGRWAEARRRPAVDVTYWNAWGNKRSRPAAS